MTTEALRATVAAGALTVPGARLWPNGIGFTRGVFEYSYDETHTGSTPWQCGHELHHENRRIGYGATPAEARRNAR